MKTESCGVKRTLRNGAFLFMLSLVLVLSAFGTVHADKHTITINNLSYHPNCDVTVTYSDDVGTQKKVYRSMPLKWESSKCAKKISGSCFDTFIYYIGSINEEICKDANYEIKWVESANQMRFVPY